MSLCDFLLNVFVLVDDLYREWVRRPLRTRGPRRTALTGHPDAEAAVYDAVGRFADWHHARHPPGRNPE